MSFESMVPSYLPIYINICKICDLQDRLYDMLIIGYKNAGGNFNKRPLMKWPVLSRPVK